MAKRDVRSLAAAFAADHPHEAARELAVLPAAQAAAYLETTEPSIRTALARHLTAGELASLLEHLGTEDAASTLGGLDPDHAAAALRRVDGEHRDAVIEALPRRGRLVRSLLRHPEDCAGAMAEPRAFTVTRDLTAAEALESLAEAGDQVRYYVYVVSSGEQLEGVVDLRTLMNADPEARIDRLMQRDVQTVPAGARREAVLRHPAWQHFHSLPVVSAGGTLVGILRHETVQRLARSRPAPSAGGSTSSALGDLYLSGSRRVLGELASALAERRRT